MPAPTGTRIVDAPSATLVHSSLVPESWRKMLARSAPRRAWVALAISIRRWSRSDVTARRRETSRTSRIFSAEMVYLVTGIGERLVITKDRTKAVRCKTQRTLGSGVAFELDAGGSQGGLDLADVVEVAGFA